MNVRLSLIRLLAGVGCALIAVGVSILFLGSYSVQTVQAQDNPPGYAGADYVGAKECASCHRNLARDHAESNHALALQEVGRKQEEILADFDQGEDVRMVQFPDEDSPRPFTADDVAYAVGAGVHVQRYLYEVDRNEYRVLPAEWDTQAGVWRRIQLGDAGDDSWSPEAYDWNSNCAYCHTTGFEPDRGRWKDDGVQCEDCHGPASNHVDLAQDAGRNPSDEELAAIRGAIYRSSDPQVCGACHSQGVGDGGVPYPVGYVPGDTLSDYFELASTDSGDHWWVTGHGKLQNMQYNEWLTSTHATSLSDMQASDYAKDTCLTCHSQDARQVASLIEQVDAGDRDGAALDPLTVETAQWGVTCTTCHQQHADTDQPFELVDEANALCVSCHTNPEGSTHVHHPVMEMFEVVSLVEGIDGVAGTHFSEENGPRCVTCHMQDEPVDDGTMRVSHGFTPVLPGESDTLPSACAGCHTGLSTSDLQLLVKNTQDAVRARLDAAQAQIDSLGETDDARYQQAVDAINFVKNDGSFGIHNYTYADALLTSAEQDLAALTGSVTPTLTPAPTVTPPSEVVLVEASASDEAVANGARPITYITIGVVIVILLTAAFAFFRKRDV